eukprot:m.106795 g.106795  ORF g.106795 m.106795 type:complete len:577 (-) comp15802_c1_seq2:164-1894(-)
MHGRVKVRTTAEQAAAKAAERAAKAKAYSTLLAGIMAKRAAGDRDAKALELTASLLTRNPDFATVWNYRRVVLQHNLDTMAPDEKRVCANAEMRLLEECLTQNPKSYCVWHQRRWIVARHPDLPWPAELDLCTKFLKMDERNFHCWDYRRHVCSQCADDKGAPDKELQYAMDLIETNFSNYSAWHYRSSLLPVVHPADEACATSVGVAEDVIRNDLEMVQNAFYIDSGDQSAWFYHRWLLGRDENPPVVCAWSAEPCAQNHVRVCLSFSHAVQLDPKLVDVCGENNKPWTPVHGKPTKPCAVWTLSVPASSVPEPMDITLKAAAGTSCGGSSSLPWSHQLPAPDGFVAGVESHAWSAITRWRVVFRDMLEVEAERCKELLEIVDTPRDRKWPLLATAHILFALDPDGNLDQVHDIVDSLKEVDPMRRCFYDDTQTGFAWIRHVRTLDPAASTTFVAGPGNLTSLQHSQLFAPLRSVDLTKNRLQSIAGVSLMHNLTHLLLDDNLIKDIEADELHTLPSLKVVSLRRNKLHSLHALRGLVALPSAEALYLEGNEVTSIALFAAFATQHLPYLSADEQ